MTALHHILATLLAVVDLAFGLMVAAEARHQWRQFNYPQQDAAVGAVIAALLILSGLGLISLVAVAA